MGSSWPQVKHTCAFWLAAGETHTITFTAEGQKKGLWQNCAGMSGDLFFGTNVACFGGEVTKK